MSLLRKYVPRTLTRVLLLGGMLVYYVMSASAEDDKQFSTEGSVQMFLAMPFVLLAGISLWPFWPGLNIFLCVVEPGWENNNTCMKLPGIFVGLYGFLVGFLSVMSTSFMTEWIPFWHFPVINLQSLIFGYLGWVLAMLTLVHGFFSRAACCDCMESFQKKFRFEGRISMFYTTLVGAYTLFFFLFSLIAGLAHQGELISETLVSGELVRVTATFPGLFFGYQQSGFKLAVTILNLIALIVCFVVYWANIFKYSGTLKKLRNPLLNGKKKNPSDAKGLPSHILNAFLLAVPTQRFDEPGARDLPLPICTWTNEDEDQLRLQFAEFDQRHHVKLSYYQEITYDRDGQSLKNQWCEAVKEVAAEAKGEEEFKGQVTLLSYFDGEPGPTAWSDHLQFRVNDGKLPWYATTFFYFVASFFGLSLFFRYLMDPFFDDEVVYITLKKRVSLDASIVPPKTGKQQLEETAIDFNGIPPEDLPDFSQLEKVPQHQIHQAVAPGDKVYDVYVEEEATTNPDGSIRWVPKDRILKATDGWQLIADYIKQRKNEPVSLVYQPTAPGWDSFRAEVGMTVPEPSMMGMGLECPASERGVSIAAGTTLVEGTVVPSGKGHFFVLQDDHNLVLYHTVIGAPNCANWASRSCGQGRGKCELRLEMNGELRIVDSRESVVWSTHTAGMGSSVSSLVVEPDGNVVLYAGPGRMHPLWMTQTSWSCGTQGIPTTVPAGLRLLEGSILSSGAGHYLVFQHDHNLVLYEGDNFKRIIWESGTSGQGLSPCFLNVQKDGNLVMYNKYEQPYWASNTGGRGSSRSRLMVLENGSIAMMNGRKRLWSSLQ